MKIGCDIEKITRIEWQNEGFFKRYYTVEEVEFCKKQSKPFESYTGIFCAKEAFLKAIGKGYDGKIPLSDIEVVHDELGAPHYDLKGKAKEALKEGEVALLTISHTDINAVAFCVING